MQLGGAASASVAAYAFGKVVLGAVGDAIGGKRIMLVALGGSVLVSFAIGATGLSFGLGTLGLFLVANRFFQSGGWGGLVHVVARWFPAERHGVVMGPLSTSYEIGNVLTLLLCSQIVASGFGWRALYLINPALLAVVGIVLAVGLRAAPPREGAPTSKAPASDRVPLREALPWLAKKPAFWATVVLSMMLTFVRTGFLTWTPTYLAEVAKAAGSPDAASGAIAKSAIFPAAGVVAALVVGKVSDRLGPGRRTPVVVVSLAIHVATVLALAHLPLKSPVGATLLIGVCGLFVLGPYSLLAGAMTLDVAGKRAAATAAGIIDGAGYAGAALVGVVLGGVAEKWGWSAAFDVVAAAGAVALALAAGWSIASARARARAA
jgi:sugar phosphate permease